MPKSIAVEFKNVSKSFGACQANINLCFTVKQGHIHAIVGENGAGKSTAMKILFGLYEADAGVVLVNGKPVQFKSPLDSMAHGIGMVHQHFMLAEPLSALDNILLPQKGSAFSLLPRRQQKTHLEALAKKYGFAVNLSAKVEDLSVGEQQRLEILKILSQDSNILILDEPTAVLTPQEIKDLFINLRALKAEGRTIIIITHKLKEVMSLSDEVTVFRACKFVAQRKTSETSLDELAELMVGHRLVDASERTTEIDFTRPVLKVENLSATQGVHKLVIQSLNVHGREVVGIAGVEGNGQDLLIRALIDREVLDKKSFTGKIETFGRIGIFPEDRLRYGVLARRPIYENFLLGQIQSFSLGPFLLIQKLIAATREVLDLYDIRPRDEKLPLKNLSGGNQQKLVVARALTQNPDFILAAQPTRGVDIGAIEFIHGEVRRCRDRGAGVLLISSELDELIALADRILVLYQGHFVAEFAKADFDEIALGTAMGGGR